MLIIGAVLFAMVVIDFAVGYLGSPVKKITGLGLTIAMLYVFLQPLGGGAFGGGGRFGFVSCGSTRTAVAFFC